MGNFLSSQPLWRRLILLGVLLDTAGEFRKQADSCVANALKAAGVADRARWVSMAQFWLELAEQTELNPPDQSSENSN